MPLEGVKTSDLIGGVFRGMCLARVLPYHIVHIEHCCDCVSHAMTTWHIPGSYEKRCSEVKKNIRECAPPSLIYSNVLSRPPGDERKTTDGMARIGAFEVVVRPYFSSLSFRIFSKLNQKVLPQASDVSGVCSSVLLPERLIYTRKRVVNVFLIDSYYKALVKDAELVLFKVKTHHRTTEESLESYSGLKEIRNVSSHKNSAVTSTKPSEENLHETAIPPPRSIVVCGRSRPFSAGSNRKHGTSTKSPSRERSMGDVLAAKRLPPKKNSSEEKEKKPTFTEELMKSEAIQDCIFRHSLAFYRVRCWSQHEVDQWMKSHGMTEQAIVNAHASGVEDGASLLALANKVTLRKWGVRAQLTLKKLDISLSAIRENLPIYDPCIIEGLPEDGQERKGFSRASPDFVSRGFRSDFEQVAVSTVSRDGYAQFDISVAGTYILLATSPRTVTFCSHAFTCGLDMKYSYSALLKPITVPVYFRVLMEDGDTTLFDGVPFASTGLLYSVVNMTCGKRHIGFANIEDIIEDDTVTAAASISPKLQRFNSIVKLFTSIPTTGAISRSQSTGAISSSTTGNSKPFARAKRKNEPKKSGRRVIVSLIWLPVGQYYSEVDGSVFSVSDSRHLNFIRETSPRDLVEALPSAQETTVKERLVFGGEVNQRAVIKCHRRLIKSSIRGFQMIYRRYKKTFLFDKMRAYMVMRRGARNFCDWARQAVRKRKVIKLQSWLRMRRDYHNYRTYWTSIVLIQSRLRVFLAQLLIKKLRKAQMILYVAMIHWYARCKRKRYNAAVSIQLMYRLAAARKKKDRLIFAQRCKRLFVRYIRRIKTKIRLANAAKLARRREYGECLAMAYEEEHAAKHLLWVKAEQRKLIELRLEAIALRKFAAATKLQAIIVRGPLLRMRMQKRENAIVRLQVTLRIS